MFQLPPHFTGANLVTDACIIDQIVVHPGDYMRAVSSLIDVRSEGLVVPGQVAVADPYLAWACLVFSVLR